MATKTGIRRRAETVPFDTRRHICLRTNYQPREISISCNKPRPNPGHFLDFRSSTHMDVTGFGSSCQPLILLTVVRLPIRRGPRIIESHRAYVCA